MTKDHRRHFTLFLPKYQPNSALYTISQSREPLSLAILDMSKSISVKKSTICSKTNSPDIVAVGCGGGSVVIKGTAKMADGATVDRGMVIFVGEKEQFSADIQSNGTFSPGRLRDGDGIPPGVYQISLSGIVREEPNPADPERPLGIPLIASKYGDHRTSGLSIDTSQTKTLDLVLDPAK